MEFAISTWSGWLAALLITCSAALPAVHRLRARKRAALGSPTTRAHVALGLATSAVAFLHTIMVLPSLGSPASITGGLVALLAGAAAFFLLVAHAGLGLQLRDPKLRARTQKRRSHLGTAIAIAIVVTAHAAALLRGS